MAHGSGEGGQNEGVGGGGGGWSPSLSWEVRNGGYGVRKIGVGEFGEGQFWGADKRGPQCWGWGAKRGAVPRGRGKAGHSSDIGSLGVPQIPYVCPPNPL